MKDYEINPKKAWEEKLEKILKDMKYIQYPFISDKVKSYINVIEAQLEDDKKVYERYKEECKKTYQDGF